MSSYSLRGQLAITNENYVFRLHSAGRVAALELPLTEFARWAGAAPTMMEVQAMTRRVYHHLQDAFDFILFISDQDGIPAGVYSGVHHPAKNDTQGIGQPLFDVTSAFGSAGRLQGALHLRATNGLRYGPSLHEIAHRWATYLPQFANTVAPVHWGFAGVGGQLGGWQPGTLMNLGGNLYEADGPLGAGSSFNPNANGGNGIPYSGLELYLMGLVEAAAVPQPIQRADGAAFVSGSRRQFTASGIHAVTMAEIISANGARRPSVSEAQRSFRSVAVVLALHPLSSARWSAYDSDVQKFSMAGSDGTFLYNFWEATGGRAVMKMDELDRALAPARLIFASLRIDDTGSGNANSAIDPGETVNLSVSLQNVGGAAAGQVSATLVSRNPALQIISPTSSYPAIPAGRTGANVLPFQLRLSPTAPCGTTLLLDQIVTADGRRMTNQISLMVGQWQVSGRRLTNSFAATDTPRTLPDFTVRYSTNVLSAEGIARNVRVWVRVDHPFVSDLEIALIHPDGTEVLLAPPGGTVSGINLGRGACGQSSLMPMRFDDQASLMLSQGVEPYAGTFQPAEPLSRFTGKPLPGIWVVRISDLAPADEGRLLCWGLDIAYDEARKVCGAVPLLIRNAHLNAQGRPTFTWNSRGGVRYRIQYRNASASLQSPFVDLTRSAQLETAPGTAGTPGTMTFTDDFSLSGPIPQNDSRWYRVKELGE